jgi:hypothetical protein
MPPAPASCPIYGIHDAAVTWPEQPPGGTNLDALQCCSEQRAINYFCQAKQTSGFCLLHGVPPLNDVLS